MIEQQLDVIFIRHAESLENVKLRHVCKGVDALKSCKLPSSKQVWSGFELCKLDLDAALSTNGKRQLVDMAEILKEAGFFDKTYPLDAVIHSPMIRATETMFALIPTAYQR